MDRQKIEKIYLKWQNGHLSKSETDWLENQKKSAEFQKEWQRLAEVWRLTGDVHVPEESTAELQWYKLETRINQATHTVKNRREKSQIWTSLRAAVFRPRLVPVYTAALLILFLAIKLYYDAHPTALRVAAAAGEQIAKNLPDGSTIELNSGSEIVYSHEFNKTDRLVHLRGEAFFQVQKTEKPFIVRTKDAHIRVTGTTFNVRTFDGITRVAVQSGTVAVSNLKNQDKIELKKGETASVGPGESAKKSGPVRSGVFAWRTGDIVFTGAPIEEAVRELNRRFAADIRVADTLHHLKITAHFRNESLAEILDYIAKSSASDLSKKGKSFWLKSR